MQYIKAFFVGLGIIFFVILLVLAYLWVVDPWNIKPLIQSMTSQVESSVGSDSSASMNEDEVSGVDGGDVQNGTSGEADAVSGDVQAGMSAEQAEALGSVGLSADAVPTTFTAEQEACFVAVLGTERVEEIKAGAVPTAAEFWAGRGCL